MTVTSGDIGGDALSLRDLLLDTSVAAAGLSSRSASCSAYSLDALVGLFAALARSHRG